MPEEIVASRIPTPIKAPPSTSEASIASLSVKVEIKMPMLGVANSAIDIVFARKWRPASTTAQ